MIKNHIHYIIVFELDLLVRYAIIIHVVVYLRQTTGMILKVATYLIHKFKYPTIRLYMMKGTGLMSKAHNRKLFSAQGPQLI